MQSNRKSSKNHPGLPQSETKEVKNLLFSAIQRADVNAVKTLISQANIHKQDVNGDTALHHATRAAEQDKTGNIIEMLLDAKANVNAENKKGETALTSFISEKNVNTENINYPSPFSPNPQFVEAVRKLINAKIDINKQDKNGDTALHHAAREIKVKRSVWQEMEGGIIKMLVEAKANVNAENKKGETALTILMGACNPKHVQFLLDNGANPNQQSLINGDTPLHTECKEIVRIERPTYEINYSPQRISIIDMLLKAGADVYTPNHDNKIALSYLMTNEIRNKTHHAKLINRLVKEGAKEKSRAKEIITTMADLFISPISAIIKAYDHHEPVEIKGEMEAQKEAEFTDVTDIISNDKIEEMEKYIKEGNLNQKIYPDPSGNPRAWSTPLHIAADYSSRMEGRNRIINLLLSDQYISSLDINQTDCTGATPLMYAVTGGHCSSNVVTRLLEKGASVKVQSTEEKETALHLGIRLLLETFTNDEDAFPEKMKERMQVIKMLIDAHTHQEADINVRDNKGNTALIEAVLAMRTLSKRFDDIQIFPRILSERMRVIMLLIEAHANPGIENNEGATMDTLLSTDVLLPQSRSRWETQALEKSWKEVTEALEKVRSQLKQLVKPIVVESIDSFLGTESLQVVSPIILDYWLKGESTPSNLQKKHEGSAKETTDASLNTNPSGESSQAEALSKPSAGGGEQEVIIETLLTANRLTFYAGSSNATEDTDFLADFLDDSLDDSLELNHKPALRQG